MNARPKNSPLLVLLLALVGFLALAPTGHAQSGSTSKVQGLVPDGTAGVLSINPVAIGGKNGSALKMLRVSSSGDLFLGAVTSASAATTILTDPSGAVYVQTSAIHPGLDTPSRVSLTSNGVTAVTIKAVSGTKAVFVGSLLFVNTGAASHTVTVETTSAVLVAGFTVSPGGTAVLGENGGIFSSNYGEGLRFYIDSGGAATDLTVSGVVYQK